MTNVLIALTGATEWSLKDGSKHFGRARRHRPHTVSVEVAAAANDNTGTITRSR